MIPTAKILRRDSRRDEPVQCCWTSWKKSSKKEKIDSLGERKATDLVRNRQSCPARSVPNGTPGLRRLAGDGHRTTTRLWIAVGRRVSTFTQACWYDGRHSLGTELQITYLCLPAHLLVRTPEWGTIA